MKRIKIHVWEEEEYDVKCFVALMGFSKIMLECVTAPQN